VLQVKDQLTSKLSELPSTSELQQSVSQLFGHLPNDTV
jgi:hypothetical protein